VEASSTTGTRRDDPVQPPGPLRGPCHLGRGSTRRRRSARAAASSLRPGASWLTTCCLSRSPPSASGAPCRAREAGHVLVHDPFRLPARGVKELEQLPGPLCADGPPLGRAVPGAAAPDLPPSFHRAAQRKYQLPSGLDVGGAEEVVASA
jgi:hypothetical protein